ncbi:MAG: hypothetical protein ABEJ23_05210 [Haloarculaceae archaeon]
MGTAYCPDCSESVDGGPFRLRCPDCGGALMAGRPAVDRTEEP